MAGKQSVYLDYTLDEIEAQYNLRARRADFETGIIPDWTRRSMVAAAQTGGMFDIAYGDSPRQELDIFASSQPNAATLVFIHGGYWRSGDKSLYRFLAPAFLGQGIGLVNLGYDICPLVTITEITAQIRQALIWLWRHAETRNLNRNRLVLMGHSAGGHLTQIMMATDWPAIAPELPKNLIKAAIPISPISDLTAILHTSINQSVRMDCKEARAQSPMHRQPPFTDAPQLVVCGAEETVEFHRQADIYAKTYGTEERRIERLTLPGMDHFDEINALADAGSDFFAQVASFIEHAA